MVDLSSSDGPETTSTNQELEKATTDFAPLDYFLRLQHMVNALSSAHTAEAVADAIIHGGLAIMGSAVGMVVLLSEDKTMFETLVLLGVTEDRRAAWKRFPVTVPSPLTLAVQERRAITFEDRASFVAAHPRFEKSQGFLSGAVLAIPMFLDTEVVGAIGLSYAEPRTFTRLEIAYLETAASQCAQAIDRVKLMEAQRVSAAREAREQTLKLMRGVVDCLGDSVVAVDRDLRLLAFNTEYEQRMVSAFGVQVHEGDALEDVLAGYPEEMDLAREHWHRALAGEAFTIVRAVGDENRTRLHYEISYGSLISKSGETVGAVYVSRDVSERIEEQNALELSAARLAEAQSIARMGSWELDVATGALTWSEGLFRLLGFDPEKGMPSLEEIEARGHSDDVKLRNHLVQKAIADGLPYQFDMRTMPGFLQGDNSVHWVHAIGKPVKDESGQVVRLQGTTVDITDRKRAEMELERYRDILEATTDFVGTTTMDGRMLYCNGAFRDFLGISEEQVQQFFARDAYSPDSHPILFNELMPTTIRTGAWSGEVLLRSHDGTDVPVSLKTFTHTDGSGTPIFRSAVARDVSEQKRAEQALLEAQNRLEEAQRVAKVGSWELDVASGKITCSREYLRSIDREFSDTSPDFMEILSLYYGEDAVRLDGAVQRAITEGTSYEMDVRRRNSAGDAVTYHATARPVVDEAGKIVRLTHTCVDITDRLQLEEELRHIQKMDSIGRLAGAIAHDFNNLLAVISGYSEVLAEELPADHTLQNGITNIQNAATRAATLTQQLLAFAHKQAIAPATVKPNELLAGMNGMLQPLIGGKIELATHLTKQTGSIYIDANQFEQIVVNLVVNARDAMPNGGRLTMRTEIATIQGSDPQEQVPAGKYVVLVVTDTGHGMSSDIKERLFEPFFTTKEKGKGTGLGLSTVYGIVKQNGGYIDVQTAQGVGTSFRIYLPFAESLEKSVVAAPAEPPAPRLEACVERILVVDDEQMVRDLMVRALKSKGYEVLEASDGSEALEIIEEPSTEIDMVVTDVIMPRLTGLELVKRMREVQRDVPVLLVSGFSEEMFTGDAVAASKLPLLRKPFRSNDLLDRVRDLLDSRTARQ